MAEASDKLGILRQNLSDAGCGGAAAEACMELVQQKQWEKLFALLKQQKGALLRQVHTNQKQIDCLDFLVYQIQKEHRQEAGCGQLEKERPQS
jgi:hypothetical protein